jgi:hypothetical protein
MQPSSGRGVISGISVLELMIATSVLAFVSLLVFKMLRVPFSLQRLAGSVDAQRDAAHATDLFVNDLHEAAPGSFDWSAIPQAPPIVDTTSILGITFSSLHYDPSNPNNPSSTTLHYQYIPVPGTLQGNLVRTLETPLGSKGDVLLHYLDQPTASTPLVYVDTTSYHVLILQLGYHPPGQPVIKLTRRVSLKG